MQRGYWTEARKAELKSDYAEGGLAKVCARHPHLKASSLQTYLWTFKCAPVREQTRRPGIRFPNRVSPPIVERKPFEKPPLTAEQLATACRHCKAVKFVIGEPGARHCRDDRACKFRQRHAS